MSEKPRGRVRFVECRLEPQAKGVRVEVALANHAGKKFTGTSEGEGERGKDPDLWHAADATVQALQQALKLGDILTLRDVVAFHIGDYPAVAVELRAMLGGKKRRLHGLYQAEDDRTRAAVLAVLAATNRTFGEGVPK
jgi:hypothetical protein